MTNTQYTELNTLIASLGLTYKVQFIAQSKSRNATEQHRSINWIITLSKGNVKLETDYMQGIGYIPTYQKLIPFGRCRTLAHENVEKLASERGKVARDLDASEIMAQSLPKPLLRDVLYSLVTDATVLDAGGFEAWANEYGMDTDSRKAEKMYNACLDIAIKLRALIGNDAIEKLQTAFQDY